MKRVLPYVIFLCLTSLIFIPYLFNPTLLVERNNDLFNQFYPFWLIFFNNLRHFSQFPLWQNTLMTGSPTLGDPIQMVYFYPVTYLSLLLPYPLFVIFFFFFHVALAGLAVYLLARRSFNLPPLASVLSGIIYMFSLQMFGRIEAGHITLVAAMAYAPLFFLAFERILHQPRFSWSMTLAVVAGFIFLNHFPYLVFAGLVFVFYLIIVVVKRSLRLKSAFHLGVSVLIFLGMTLPHLLALVELYPQTTRVVLEQNPTVNAVAWSRFITSIFFPFVFGLNSFHEEATLFLGILPLIFAIYGYLSLAREKKIILAVFFGTILLLTIEYKTPFYPTLLAIVPFFALIRVPSKSWFLVNMAIAILAGFGFERFRKSSFVVRRYQFVIGLVCLELVFVGLIRLNRPTISVVTPAVYQPLYQVLVTDKDYYRLYCTTGCLSENEIINANKSLNGGYQAVQLAHYFAFMQTAGGYRFNGYSAFIPPYQTYADRPQPSAKLLGLLKTRYVLSPYELSDPDFNLENKYGLLLLYRNQQVKPRVYWTDGQKEVTIEAKFSPNRITIPIDNFIAGKVIISEIYYPAWKATIDGESTPVLSERDIIMSVPLPGRKSQSLVLFYQPLGWPWTYWLSAGTLLVVVFSFFIKRKV